MKKCTKCFKELPTTSFTIKSNGFPVSWCRDCHNAYSREKSKEKPRVRTKEQQRKRCLQRILATHKLSEREYFALIEKQKRRCALCLSSFKDSEERFMMVVDHNHATGKVRGILCYKCNNGLGQFNDDVFLLRNAIEYIKRDGGV